MDLPTYGAQAILSRLDAVTAEIDGVRSGNDIEHIHNMRVAVRRLRTALGLFPELVPAKAKWQAQIKTVASALGQARDADVQIEFLHQALVKAPQRIFRPGLQRLALRLTQDRAKQQPKVLKALKKFEKSDAPAAIRKALTLPPVESDAPAPAQAANTADLTLFTHAYLAVQEQVQAALAFDQAVHDPSNVTELHQLRIVFKHLRYTLEVFAPLYTAGAGAESQLAPSIKIVKTFQEVLGDIHDCDVWVASLPAFSKEERERTQEYFGTDRSFKTLEPGLAYLLEERQYQRSVRYNEFLDLWIAHREAKTWSGLVDLTASAAQQSAGALVVPTAPNFPDASCIALIGDIHGNLPALEAILAHARKHGATAIWNVGDFVGYGVFPNEVVKLLQSEAALSISGNYDLKTLQVKEKKEKWKKSKRPEKLLAFEWAYEHLGKDSRQYLSSLPQERRFTTYGKRILITHGSPESNEEPLASETPIKRLRELAQQAQADVIIVGHSHQPFTKTVDGVLFVNTGSVGRPDDGDPRACYALLTLTPDSLSVKHYRVKYDTEKMASAVRDAGLPESFARIFLHGRSLDDLVIEGETETKAKA